MKENKLLMPSANKKKPIYNKKLAGFLLLRGCRLVSIEIDEQSNNYVFNFTDTPKTKQTIKAYYGNN